MKNRRNNPLTVRLLVQGRYTIQSGLTTGLILVWVGVLDFSQSSYFSHGRTVDIPAAWAGLLKPRLWSVQDKNVSVEWE